MEIVFTNVGGAPEHFVPKPASKFVPDWYKNTSGFINKIGAPRSLELGEGPTIKKCLPIFDLLTAGYIIPLPADLYVSQRENVPYYQWPSIKLVDMHPWQQADKHPEYKGLDIPKFLNPWSIKTPKGYSSLFIQPAHHDLPFYIFPAIVDTDTYNGNVNFPFILKDLNFTGTIEAGTPIAQVIPIKREKWTNRFGDEKEIKQNTDHSNFIHSKFLNAYKEFFRQKKEYL